MATATENVIVNLNKVFGSDVKQLGSSVHLVASLSKRIEEIETQLNVNKKGTQSQIKDAIVQADNLAERINRQLTEIDEHEVHLAKKIDTFTKVIEEVSPPLAKISLLDNSIRYYSLVRDIQTISNDIKSALNTKDEMRAVQLYLSLAGEQDSMDSIMKRLANVDAPHLQSYATKTADYWHDQLNERFSTSFEAILKTIKWPYISQGVDVFNPSKDALTKLSVIAEYLFLLQSPNELKSHFIMISPTVTCLPISTPTKLLLKSFRSRFQYHFTGSKPTNRLDKPEWYFTQILAWSKFNHLFVGDNFQMAAKKAGHHDLNVRLEFVRGLVQLTIEKLCVDMTDVSGNDQLFAHLLDEILSFEVELRDSLGYPTNFPSAITVLTKGPSLLQWIAIEKKVSADTMDTILTTGNPWEILDTGNFESIRIPRCADQFIRLLDAIKERYSCLVQAGHQFEFLQLQIELIDNFRQRLVQLHNSSNAKIHVGSSKILNAIYYIISVLREWGENVHYLSLYATLGIAEDAEISTVFDKSIENFEHYQNKLVEELALKIVDEIKAKSMPYRHDSWISMPQQGKDEPFILSSNACEMFQIMATGLHNLERDLSASLCSKIVRLIAFHMDDFLLYGMIMNTKFSTGGANQFQYDMRRNLFVLFGHYARRPDILFKNLHDSCKLLTLKSKQAIELRNLLVAKNNEASFAALRELRIANLSPHTVTDVLERRMDVEELF